MNASNHTSLRGACHRACATHHRLVDRRAPAQQGPHAFQMSVLTGGKQWCGPNCLQRHTPHKPHNIPTCPTYPHKCGTCAAADNRDAPRPPSVYHRLDQPCGVQAPDQLHIHPQQLPRIPQK
jgi:hypothetical protein